MYLQVLSGDPNCNLIHLANQSQQNRVTSCGHPLGLHSHLDIQLLDQTSSSSRLSRLYSKVNQQHQIAITRFDAFLPGLHWPTTSSLLLNHFYKQPPSLRRHCLEMQQHRSAKCTFMASEKCFSFFAKKRQNALVDSRSAAQRSVDSTNGAAAINRTSYRC